MVLTHRFSVMSLSLLLNQGKAQDSVLVAVPSLIRVSSCAHRLKFSAFVFSSVSPQVNSTWGWQGWAPSVLYSLLLAYRGVAPPPLQALHHMWRSVLLGWLYLSPLGIPRPELYDGAFLVSSLWDDIVFFQAGHTSCQMQMKGRFPHVEGATILSS